MIAGMVPSGALAKAWPMLWPMLEPAAVRSDLKEEAVLTPILSDDAKLWAIVDDGVPIAAVTTQITLHAEKRCRIWLVGGSRMAEWAPTFLAKVEPLARSMGCVALWGSSASRPGWQRMTRSLGFEPIEPVDGNPSWGRRL